MYVRAKQFDAFVLKSITSLDCVPLGPAYKTLSGYECQENLVKYRMKKKFAKPGKSDANRAHKSVRDMLAYDADGLINFEPARMTMSSEARSILYKARAQLHKLFGDFKFLTRNCDFPSGESYDSARGDISLLAKLRDKKHWKVTPDCFELFARVVYDTIALKRAAKHHMPLYTKADNRKLILAAHSRRKKRKDCTISEFLTNGDFGFFIFMEKLRSVVTFMYGSRLATVPKDKDKDRVIEVECMGNMIVQRTIGITLRQRIKTAFDVDLETAQDDHKKLISDPQFATIDLSNASNSNWMCVIDWLLPHRLTRFLKASRAAVVSYQGEYFGLNMLSPMGNGFTFEVMTLVLLAMSRVNCKHSRVYGDDIIITNHNAPALLQALDVCGYVINKEKTFIDSKFRESCGAFFHDDVGYIKSYDFTYPETDYARMIIVNKLWRLGKDHRFIRNIHGNAIAFFDSLALRRDDSVTSSSLESDGFLDQGVLCSRAKRKKIVTSRPTAYTKALEAKRTSAVVSKLLSDLQYEKHQVDYCMIPELLTKKYKSAPVHLHSKTNKWFWYAFYLRNGLIRPSVRKTHERKTVRVMSLNYLLQ